MTAPTPDSEPTGSEILAAIRAQGRVLSEIAAKVGQLEADQRVLRDSHAQMRGETRATLDRLGRDVETLRGEVRDGIAQVRADVAGVKTDMGFVEQYQADMHEAVTRHIADPNAHRPAA